MAQSPKLYRIDIKILTALHRDVMIPNAAFSKLVGLSPGPCLQRVKRMEFSGLSAGYQAEIDVHRLANTITIFTEITIADHRREDFATFEKRVEQFPEVFECHLISGAYDYLLKFVSRSVSDYQSSIERLLDAQIGIEKYFSYIVIKSPIAGRKPELSNIVGIG